MFGPEALLVVQFPHAHQTFELVHGDGRDLRVLAVLGEEFIADHEGSESGASLLAREELHEFQGFLGARGDVADGRGDVGRALVPGLGAVHVHGGGCRCCFWAAPLRVRGARVLPASGLLGAMAWPPASCSSISVRRARSEEHTSELQSP